MESAATCILPLADPQGLVHCHGVDVTAGPVLDRGSISQFTMGFKKLGEGRRNRNNPFKKPAD